MKRRLILGCALVALGALGAQTLSGLIAVPTARAQLVQTARPPLQANQSPRSPAAHWTPEERVNIAVYEGANRGVVNINTRSVQFNGIFFQELPSEGAGSGTVLDRQGHILTNAHVIEDAQQIEVTLAGGQTYPAKVLGTGAVSDVAVLKIDAPPGELHPLTLGESGDLRVGQKVYAIGNPFGLERTLTTGIVSSLNRSLPNRRTGRVMKSIIQVDAAMNPGNSGGPLLDSSGKMIGMNTAIVSRTGQNTGVGFAIPVNRIKRIVPDLIKHGQVIRPETGIARVLETDHGLLVAKVSVGSPAEQAGIQGFRVVRRRFRRNGAIYETTSVDRSEADLITQVDGHKIRTVDEFLTQVEEKNPGEKVVLSVVRNGQQRQVVLQLAANTES